MEKPQGSLRMSAAEGADCLELTVHGERIGLATMIQAMKSKLKVYDIKNLDDRELTLTLEVRERNLEEQE